MRVKFIWISLASTLLIAALIVVGLTSKNGTVLASFGQTPPPAPINAPQPQPSSAAVKRTASVGIPAIPIDNNAATTNSATPENTTQPASRITQADVQTYLQNHPFPGGPAVSGTTPKVQSITLVTSKQASQMLQGEDIGVSDTTPVYYVVWQGSFHVTNASVPPGASLPTASQGVEIFDATTGNLLLWWVPN